MKIQIRTADSAIINVEAKNAMEIVEYLQKPNSYKVSFDFVSEDSGFRLALYADGTYQIFGGFVNFPALGE